MKWCKKSHGIILFKVLIALSGIDCAHIRMSSGDRIIMIHINTEESFKQAHGRVDHIDTMKMERSRCALELKQTVIP